MFKPRKPGRLSRRMGRLIVLFAYPAFALVCIELTALFVGFFYSPALALSDLCFRIGMPLLLITLFLLLFFRCPWCGRPQVAHRLIQLRQDIEYDNHTRDFRTFPAKWKAPHGGYCMWCDCLMQYDDVE